MDTMWLPHGHYMVSIWKPCSFHVDTMWFPFGHYLVSTWMHYIVSTLTPHGFHIEHHMVSTWTPCGVQETKWKLVRKKQLCMKPTGFLVPTFWGFSYFFLLYGKIPTFSYFFRILPKLSPKNANFERKNFQPRFAQHNFSYTLYFYT